jgi:adenylate kinase
MRLVFLGPPGVGKGTQAKRLSADRRLAHVSTGDMLREAIRQGTPVGLRAKAAMDRGELVPDTVVIDLIKERLRAADAQRGVVLDGFPRTVEQARALDLMLKSSGLSLDAVVSFACSREKIIERLSGRRVCRKCGGNYHLTYMPPRTAGRCDQCGGELIQRDDDRPEAIAQRLEVYEHQTAPLIQYYQQGAILREVSAEGDVEAIASEVKTLVETLASPAGSRKAPARSRKTPARRPARRRTARAKRTGARPPRTQRRKTR